MSEVKFTIQKMGCTKCKHYRVHSPRDSCDMSYVYCMRLPIRHCFERDMRERCKGNLFEEATKEEINARRYSKRTKAKNNAY